MACFPRMGKKHRNRWISHTWKIFLFSSDQLIGKYHFFRWLFTLLHSSKFLSYLRSLEVWHSWSHPKYQVFQPCSVQMRFCDSCAISFLHEIRRVHAPKLGITETRRRRRRRKICPHLNCKKISCETNLNGLLSCSANRKLVTVTSLTFGLVRAYVEVTSPSNTAAWKKTGFSQFCSAKKPFRAEPKKRLRDLSQKQKPRSFSGCRSFGPDKPHVSWG